MTSKPPPSSIGTRSTSPSRQEPWHAVIEAAVLDRNPGDLPLRIDPGLPHLLVPLLLPDADVDLGQVVAAGPERAVRVREHAPVVERVEALAQAVDDPVPLPRTAGSCE